MIDTKQKCPKCGHTNVYVGITTIECGYDKTCDNYTERQANKIKKYIEENTPTISDENDEDVYSLWDSDDDGDDTNPYGYILPTY